MHQIIAMCKLCKQETLFIITPSQAKRYKAGKEKIQDIFPNLSIDERELLVSRICGTCYDKIFEGGE